MRLRKDTIPKPEPKPPFPLRMYIVGEAPDGEEVVRYDLDVTLTGIGQQLCISNVALTLKA